MEIKYQNFFNKIFNEISCLKELVTEQNIALFAGNFDLYVELDNKKLEVKKIIDANLKYSLKNKIFDDSLLYKLKKIFIEILTIEKSNNNILQFQLEDLFYKKNKINLNKRVNKTYYPYSSNNINNFGNNNQYNKVF